MPDHLGDDMRKVKNAEKDEEKDIKCMYDNANLFSYLENLLFLYFLFNFSFGRRGHRVTQELCKYNIIKIHIIY